MTPKPARPLGEPALAGPAPARRAASLVLDGAPRRPAASPALLMQQRLATEVEGVEDRWPWRLTVCFVLVTCSAFWGALYALVRLAVG